MLPPIEYAWLSPIEWGASTLSPVEWGAIWAAMGPPWVQVELVAALPALAAIVKTLATQEVELLGLGDGRIERLAVADAVAVLRTGVRRST